MLTASLDAAIAAGRSGLISIHRTRPEFWPGPTYSVIGRGPWVQGEWSRQANEPPLVLALKLHLDGLDAARTWAQLHELAGGAEPVLVSGNLSVERTLRRVVARWFLHKLGETVPELGAGRDLITDPWTI